MSIIKVLQARIYKKTANIPLEKIFCDTKKNENRSIRKNTRKQLVEVEGKTLQNIVQKKAKQDGKNQRAHTSYN